ncbi:hypothetical protein JTE90_023814 [Oedothorax gibbosus]|uniref:Uncharacterized protein n=1 Tax=Oedothorax gibbosus TaxID=931172 RepID=A0AAV6VJF7_9ARAC|nr:hypothetical protein JTE90_023814 [Oedothorax gibbosus]
MRQKGDKMFVELLPRIRLGIVTNNDFQILSKKKINFKGESRSDELEELCQYMQQQPKKTICLLPTKAQTEDIKMLELIPKTVVELIAKDDIKDCMYLKNRASKKLNAYEEDNSRFAGLHKKIKVKRGKVKHLIIINFVKDASGQ